MDDHVGIVRHHPLAEGISIHSRRLDAVFFLEFVAQFAGDGLEMRLGGAGANDEEVRESHDATKVDGDDVFGFFFRDVVGAEAG